MRCKIWSGHGVVGARMMYVVEPERAYPDSLLLIPMGCVAQRGDPVELERKNRCHDARHGAYSSPRPELEVRHLHSLL